METRTERLKAALLAAPFQVCAERAVLWTEAQRASEGRPQVVRNALALKHVLEHMSIAVRDEELIVGNRAGKLRAAPLFPETKSLAIATQLDTWETRPIQPFRVGASEKNEINKIIPYWRGRSAWDRAMSLMPPDLKRDVYTLMFSVEAEFANGIGHFIVGNPNLIKNGLAGIRDEAQKKLEAANGADPEQKEFWEAVTITSDAAMAFSARFAAEARRLAARESDEQRGAELRRIAAVCDRVPARPPRDFHEAIQAVWFNQLICQLECGGFAISPGRLDQLLFPFYRSDREAGRITPDQARELIECLFIKMSEVVNVLDTVLLSVTSGPPIAQSLTIGGTDAVNDLTYLFLDAFDRIRTVSPNLAVRFQENTPPEFTLRVMDAVRRGAMMALFNDGVIVPGMERKGATPGEARDYAIVGCVEPTTAGSTFASTDSNLVNIARCLELALHDGDGLDFLKDRKYLARRMGPYTLPRRGAPGGRMRHYRMLLRYFAGMGRLLHIPWRDLYAMFRGRGIGPGTGDPRAFKSIDDLIGAYQKQVAHAVGRMAEAMQYCDRAHAELKATPFISSTIDDCLERGRDVTRGGARHNFTGPQAVGLADVADSLAAVQKLVFDEGRVGMDELVAALESDFAGAEPLRQTLLARAPKYGNDDDEADAMAQKAAAIYCEEVSKLTNYRGGKYAPGIYGMSAHLAFGIFTGATPDGRQKGEPLAAGVSPRRGRELKGPAAVMRSVARVDGARVTNGYVLNMSFDPALMDGEKNLEKFAALNRAFFKQGGLHVQHNVVSAETLRKAQQDPENYAGLVVRVAGYSALFTQLDRVTQDDIILRTAHGCER